MNSLVTPRPRARAVALALVATLAVAGCTDSESRPSASGPLSSVCPDPVVIQTDWYPEAEHGALFHLADDRGFTVDAEQGRARGRLVSRGTDMGVDIEIRSGGETIDHSTVAYQLHHDPDILMGIVITDQAIVAHPVHPTTAVVTLLERDPMMIMWDPATYQVETLTELPDDVPVSVFGPAPYLRHLIDAGILNDSQIEPLHLGTPDRFVAAGGTIAQQGYATTDPHLFQQSTDGWDRPIAFELIHDTGWEVYGGALAVRPEALDQWAPCLELLVPVIQRAIIDYVADPEPANDRLGRAAEPFDPIWRYDAELAQVAVSQQRSLDLVGNGPDSTVGNFDPPRLQRLLDRAREVIEVEPDLAVDDLVTDRFIDPTIGFAD